MDTLGPRPRQRCTRPRPQEGVLGDQRPVEVAREGCNLAREALGQLEQRYLTVLMNATSDCASLCETWPGLMTELMTPGV